ncbi:ATP-binding protein [Nostocales cyanobacterium HT-58-2]|nr:ATP-binding protein [Nostocales cyanobacterium HT-58-2]
MNYKIFFKINTDIANLSQVLSWFEQLNEPPLDDTNIWWQCQTLLIEGFTNIVEHAHKNLPVETPIEIEAMRSNEKIEIRIWYSGEPFNLEKKLQDTVELEENEEERGRGLKIMSAIADNLRYERTTDNRSCLFMGKFY